MSKDEFVELTVKIPKTIFEYLFDTQVNIEDYITRVVLETIMADIENSIPEQIMEKYNLKPVFKAYGVLPPYYSDP